MKRTLANLAIAGLVAATVWAQGPQGPGRGSGSGKAAGGLNMAQQTTVEGTITSLQIGFGTRTPSFVVAGKLIRLAPVWYFLENDFELAPGEHVRVIAAPATDGVLHAVAVAKTATGTTLQLRNDGGIPLWIGPAAMNRPGQPQGPSTGPGPNPNPPRAGTPCLDPRSVETVTGVADEVTAGYGIQHPSVTLVNGDTRLLIKLGPERILQASPIDFEPGVTLTIQFAVSTCAEERVALTVTDAAGQVLVLRNADGRPAW